MAPPAASLPPSGSPAGPRPGAWRATGVLFAVLLAFAPALPGPFLFDDDGAVVNNPTIRQLGWAALAPPATGATTTGRPVVNLSFALDHALGAREAWRYRLTNVAIHALAALGLLGLVRRTLEFGVAGGGRKPVAPGLAAFFVGLIWAVHPLQTESVICIAQRTELLCGLFYILTLYGLARGVDPAARGRRWLALSVAACLLGMGSKEVMVTAPLVALLYDRTFVAGTFHAAWHARRGYYLALAGTWLLLVGLVVAGGAARGAAAGLGLGVSPWNYLLTQAGALVLYLQLAAWPHPLVLDYGTAVVTSVAEVWWQGLAILALLGATIWALGRKPVAGFLGAAFFLILAPSSSVVPLVTQTIAEHRMYLPLAAVILLVALGLARRLPPAAITAGASLLAAILLVATAARSAVYRDAVGIWADNVAQKPDNPRGHLNLALALEVRGEAREAATHFDRAVELAPRYVMAHYNRGVFLLGQGRLEEAIAALRSAVELAPDHADAHLNLGAALVRAGRAEAALPHLAESARLYPSADAAFNQGQALLALGRPAEAARHFAAAVQLDPGLAPARFELALLAERAGRRDEAESGYRELVRLQPAHAGGHARLGLILARTGRLAEAERVLRRALELAPAEVEARANLGNVLLLLGRPAEAIACYEEVVRLRPDDARARENLQLAREALAGR